MRLIIVLLLVVVLTGGLVIPQVVADRTVRAAPLASRDDHHGGHGADDTPTAAAGAAVVTPAPAGAVVVRIVDRSFSPANVTVAAGQSITFVNASNDPHTATGSGFDTGSLAPGGSATITRTTPGTFAYRCNFHPEMQGTITVTAGVTQRAATTQPVAGVGGTPPATPRASPAVATVPVTVASIHGFAFDPPQLEVAVGTRVTWTNQDPAPHTVTADDGAFASAPLDPSASFSWTFEQAGTFAYHCAVHPSMQGTIVVK